MKAQLYVIPCGCGSDSASLKSQDGNYWVSCSECLRSGGKHSELGGAITDWNNDSRTFTRHEIIEIQNVFRIASKDQFSQGNHYKVIDIGKIYDRVKKLLICEDGHDSHIHEPM